MILQLTHITVCTNYFDSVINNLIKLGYKKIFIEKNQKNLKIKKHLMTNYSNYHQLAILESKTNFNLEIVQYPEINFVNENFKAKPENSFFNEKNFISELEKKNNWKNFPKIFDFNKLKITTNDIEQSRNFWEILGFSINQKNKNLNFQSILDNRIYGIELIKKSFKSGFLNNHGISSIAFLTNSIKYEKKNLEKNGFYTTDIDNITIRNKTIELFFCKNKSGEIIEIYSVTN